METVTEDLPMEAELVRRVKLTFKDSLIKEPLIYKMSTNYNVITNIEIANITATEGWVILTVTGTDRELDKAFQWMLAQDVIIQSKQFDNNEQ